MRLRRTGHSLPEIKRIVGCGYGTVWRYIIDVEVLPEYKDILRIKQGGSKERAKRNWETAKKEATELVGNFSHRDLLVIMAGIYWGEGTKASLSLINGDRYLVRTFIQGLLAFGVHKDDIRLNFRLFSDMNETQTINYWLEFLGFDKKCVGKSEIIEGNGQKKLQYGMCRVRVIKGARHFKRVMSMIDLLKSPHLPS